MHPGQTGQAKVVHTSEGRRQDRRLSAVHLQLLRLENKKTGRGRTEGWGGRDVLYTATESRSMQTLRGNEGCLET